MPEIITIFAFLALAFVVIVPWLVGCVVILEKLIDD